MYTVDENLCNGCAACLAACRQQAIIMADGRAHISIEQCTACGSCAEVCPQGAIEWVETTVPVSPSQLVAAKPVTPAQAPVMTGVALSETLESPSSSRATSLWQNQVRPLLGGTLLWAGRQLLTGVLTELDRRAVPDQQSIMGSTSTSSFPTGSRHGGRHHRQGRPSGWPGGSACS